jgi:hypothetical protein
MQTKHTPETIAQLVDELAAIRADLADLKATEEAYRAELIAAGITEADGTLHRVTISQTIRSVTDWQTIAEKFEPSRQLIAAHTKQSAPSFTVRITARKVTR